MLDEMEVQRIECDSLPRHSIRMTFTEMAVASGVTQERNLC